MRTHLSLAYEQESPLPPAFDDDHDVRMPSVLVERLLEEFTEPGDRVLDPFAGFGTTLTVAERLGREPFGVEYDRRRAEYVAEHIERPENVLRGDAFDLPLDRFPTVECVLTSPPFMNEWIESNPFENYSGESSYERYLDDVEAIFAGVREQLAPGGVALVHVSNMKYEGDVSTPAWDVADAVGNVLRFDGEIVVAWEGGADEREGTFGYGYDHSYCLVFEKAD